MIILCNPFLVCLVSLRMYQHILWYNKGEVHESLKSFLLLPPPVSRVHNGGGELIAVNVTSMIRPSTTIILDVYPR